MSEGAEYGELCKQCQALCWAIQNRNDKPVYDAVTNPVSMMKIVAHNTQKANLTVESIDSSTAADHVMKQSWITVQEDSIKSLADAVPSGDKQRVLQMLAKVKSSGDRRSRDLKRIIIAATNMAMTHQTARWNRALAMGLPPQDYAFTIAKHEVERGMETRDPVAMRDAIDDLASKKNVVI